MRTRPNLSRSVFIFLTGTGFRNILIINAITHTESITNYDIYWTFTDLYYVPSSNSYFFIYSYMYILLLLNKNSLSRSNLIIFILSCLFLKYLKFKKSVQRFHQAVKLVYTRFTVLLGGCCPRTKYDGRFCFWRDLSVNREYRWPLVPVLSWGGGDSQDRGYPTPPTPRPRQERECCYTPDGKQEDFLLNKWVQSQTQTQTLHVNISPMFNWPTNNRPNGLWKIHSSSGK